MSPSLSNRVAIVTGAGRGLGRAHALALARHGAALLVNDLSDKLAECVAEEIRAAGGRAMGYAANVADADQVAAMVAACRSELGAVDILVNNAGLLRDKSFAKMTLDDFRLVVDVHLMGSVHCAKAVWDEMRARRFGRILFTTSSSGLYGNFGQANYSAAKMALVGLMQTLAIEGARDDIRVNCLAPSADTDMTRNLYSTDALACLEPDAVSHAVVALVGDDAPTRTVMLAGAGRFAQANVTMTRGVYLGGSDLDPARVHANLERISDRAGEIVPASGAEQYQQEVASMQGALR